MMAVLENTETMVSSNSFKQAQQNLNQMHRLSSGVDVLIVCSSTPLETTFWKKRLNSLRGQLYKEQALLIVVEEDWPGGAGNALGTLYAFQQAYKKAKTIHNVDLLEAMQKGLSIALYHTAGKGTRLAPLTSSEGNSKSKVKLPSYLRLNETLQPMTLLEATIKQSHLYAQAHQKRLLVFWTDQLFIPTQLPQKPWTDIAIFGQCLPALTEKEWIQRSLHKYGLLVSEKNQSTKQYEKLDFNAFQDIYSNDPQQQIDEIALSLGCFSLSCKILEQLLILFEPELTEKKGKLDTDPHLWMPLSLDYDIYKTILEKKGFTSQFIKTHYIRLQNFKEKNKNLCQISIQNVGKECFWFDYGNLSAFYKNILKLTNNSQESELLKQFFLKNSCHNSNLGFVESDSSSIMMNCNIQQGTIKNSVLIGVTAQEINVENTVLIDVSALSIQGCFGMLYNVKEPGSITLAKDQVRADVFISKDPGHVQLHQSIHNLPDNHWKTLLSNNLFSYEEIFNLNLQEQPEKTKSLSQLIENKIKNIIVNYYK